MGRIVVASAAFLLLTVLLPARAQPAGKVPRLGYITNDPVSADVPRRNAFKQSLRDLGYTEGQNLIVEYRIAEGKSEKLPQFMDELLRFKPDVIFAFTTLGTQAAQKATKEVPIVFAAHSPVELGLVESLARPGGNLTGLSLSAGVDIYGKYIELLKEVVPKLSRVAALLNPANRASTLQFKETQAVAAALSVTLVSFPVKEGEDIENVFTAMKKEHVGGVSVLPDAMLLVERVRIANLAIKSRLPSIYGITEHVDAGGLMSYAANRLEIFRRAAYYVDKILKGAKPADLPVEQPTKFELVINLKAAKQIGLTIPPNVLARADRVIK